jgi:peptidoglycan/xylan/chitin deacetylase (PgdA/CDA1 family)
MKDFFLRCDDVVRPDRAFLRVFELLSGLGLPLSCAVIPAGAGAALGAFFRKQQAAGARVEALQHGLSHAEHAGNRYLKQEFGPARRYDEQLADLAAGKEKLARLLGKTPPIFVPPFHAYNSDTLRALRALGFSALSASRRPERLPRGLAFLPTRVTVNEYDLRLRPRPLDLNLLKARTLAAIKEKGPAGIYFHHADLNDKDFKVFSAYAAFLKSLAGSGLARFALCSELLKKSAR